MNVFKSPAITVEREGTITVSLPHDSRVVIIQKGERPVVAPMVEAGNYDISFEEVRAGKAFPIIVTVVKEMHIRFIEKLPQSEIDRIVDFAPRATRTTVH